MNPSLENLLSSNRHVWRGRGAATAAPGRALATGYSELDAVLPGKGWPTDALLELVMHTWGIGELQLLLPAMVKATQEGRWLVWIAPPHLPYAASLVGHGIVLKRMLLLQPSRQEEVAWAMEKALRQRRCAMVLAWPGNLKPVMVRRLQLAAEAGQSLGVLFHNRDNGGSPAALRLRLNPLLELSHARGLSVDVLKSRSACRRQTVKLCFS